jgi:response regulator NasT
LQKVIVAFESEANSVKLREIIESGGVASCLVCRSASEVKRVVQKQRLRVIICGFKLPDESCQDLYADLPKNCSMLMIAPQSRLELCEEEEIFKLSSPIYRADLLASVRMLLQMNQKVVRQHPQRTDGERALVEQAKSLLMDRYDMTEEQAHRFLQKKSMDNGAKLTDTARMILTGD